MRRIALAVALLLLAPATAHAGGGPGRLIDSATDSSTFTYASVWGYVRAPKAIRYRVSMLPHAFSEGTVSVSCTKGQRSDSTDYGWWRARPFMARVHLTMRRPDSCSVGVDFQYSDWDRTGWVKLDLFAKPRKRDR